MFSENMIVAIFYMLGVVLSSKLDMSAILFATLSAVAVFVIRHSIGKKSGVVILVCAISFFIGGIRYFSASENGLCRELSDKYVTALGIVISVPTESGDTYRYIVRADEFTYLDATYVGKEKILINTDRKLAYGDRISVKGFLREISGINNSGEYDYSRYYKSVGISNRIAAREIVKIGEEKSLEPIFLIGMLKYKISALTDKYFAGNRAALYKAITVGDKTGFSGEYESLLVRTGVYRILYSAYIHISMILMLAGFFLRRKKREERDYAVMVLLTLYILFNSTSPILIKAATVLGMMIFRKSVFGFSNKMDVLSVIALIMTFVDPMLCFNGGLVISVASTVVVYTSYPIMKRQFYKGFRKGKFASKIKSAVAMWITLLFGTLPLAAYFYGGVSVYGILITYMCMPFMAILLVISPFLLGTFAIFGHAPILYDIVNFMLSVIEEIPYLIEKLPFCYLTLKKPEILEIIAFYIVWWMLLLRTGKASKGIKIKVLAVILAGVVIGSVNGYTFNSLSLYFVNVGQGDGAVLKTSRGEVVLIDGGGAEVYETEYNVGEKVYVPYLISHGLTDIDVAIVSHYHKDHIEGIIAAAKHFKIDTIVMPDVMPENEYRKELECIAMEKGINIEYLMGTDEIRFKSGLLVRFISPDGSKLCGEENDTSLVAEVRFGEFCGIFTGDSGYELDGCGIRDVDILKVAHHGSEKQNSKKSIEYIKPEYAVISVGEENSYALPDIQTLERLKEVGAKILRTDKCGDICFKVRKDGKIKFETLRGGI